MRITKLAPIAVIFVAACAAGDNPVVDAEAARAAITARTDAVTAAEQAFMKAPSPEKAKAAAAFYAEDAVLQGAFMPAVNGRAAIENLYIDFGKMGITDFSSTPKRIEVAASGDLAWETGANSMTVAGVTTVGKYLAVWKKTGNEWLVAGIAFSDDAPPAPTAPAPAKKN